MCLPRGVSAWGSAWGACLLGGVCPGGRVCPGGGGVSQTQTPSPPVDRILDTCLWKYYLRLRAVIKTLPYACRKNLVLKVLVLHSSSIGRDKLFHTVLVMTSKISCFVQNLLVDSLKQFLTVHLKSKIKIIHRFRLEKWSIQYLTFYSAWKLAENNDGVCWMRLNIRPICGQFCLLCPNTEFLEIPIIPSISELFTLNTIRNCPGIWMSWIIEIKLKQILRQWVKDVSKSIWVAWNPDLFCHYNDTGGSRRISRGQHTILPKFVEKNQRTLWYGAEAGRGVVKFWKLVAHLGQWLTNLGGLDQI